MSDTERTPKTVPESITHVGLRLGTKHAQRATLPLLKEPGIFSAQSPTDLTRDNAHEARFDRDGFIYLSTSHPSLYWDDMTPIEERTSGEVDLSHKRQRDVVQHSDYASLWYSQIDGVEDGLRWICHKLEDEGMYEHPNNPYFVLLQQERRTARWVTDRVIREIGIWENWPDLMTEQMPVLTRHFTSVESQDYLATRLAEAIGLDEVRNRPSEDRRPPIRVRPYLSAISGMNLFYDQSVKPLLQSGELTEARKQVVRARLRLQEIMTMYTDWRVADPSPKRSIALQKRLERARGVPYSHIAA